jgi:hypothetical protein
MNDSAGQRPRGSTHVSAAAVTIAVLGLAGILILRTAGGPGGPPASSASSDAPTIESSRPAPVATTAALISPTAEPAPAWVADLAGQLECDGPLSRLGQEVPAEIGPFDPAPSPERAIEGLLQAGTYAWLPASGFDAPQVDGHWARSRYVVGGRLKAIVVSTNRFPEVPDEVRWEVVGLRACDPSEFDPADGLTDESTLWLDADGRRVPAARLVSRPGPGHCGWESITFLEFEDQQYLRDVKGLLADSTTFAFKKIGALPEDAVDTGLHTATQRLFTVPSRRVVFVRSKDGTIERWGRAIEPIGCM